MNMASYLRVWRLITLLLIVVILCPFTHGKVIYVDDDAVGLNDGTNWENAYTFLQDALADAETAEKPVEIRVAQGIYKPYQGSWEKATDSIASFQLINDVTIAGGYAGFGESDPNARNIELYETILSGDLNSNDKEVNDPCDLLLVEFNRGDNSDHVVKGSNTNASAILDGFTITGGHLMAVSMGPPTGGAGMYIASGSPTIINCTFTGNAASQAGGGMYNIAGCPTLIDCKFENNYAEFGAGMYNTYTIYIPQRSKPVLINCSFDGNYSGREGGGIYNFKSDPNLTNCKFSHNFALACGAGIYNSYSNIESSDTLFIENAAGSGGGIYSEDNSSLIVTNCNFRNNIAKAAFGGGICNWDANELIVTYCTFSGNVAMRDGGGIFNRRSSSMLTNCIFNGNIAGGKLISSDHSTSSEKGGGLYLFGDTKLINCTFHNNWASEGGGVYYYRGVLTIAGCTFTSNSAENYGGGLYNYDNMPDFTIVDCTFGGNSAEWGGGIFNHWSSQLRMSNCVFTGNIASNGSALSCDPSFTALPGRIELTNCILWNGENTLFDPNPDGSTIAVTYSDVQGGWPGEGNINADPCFADLGYWADTGDPNIVVELNDPNAVWIEGDYHLKSQAGRWDPVSKSWIVDDVTSPCIDAGDPNMPVGDEPVPNGGRINMGAYGGTPEASKSYILSKIIYVDDDAVGLNDGTNWQNAYTSLQDALDDAKSAIKRVEIRVAQGTYKPKLETGYRISGTNITTSYLSKFQLINGVALLGGYAGLTGPDPDIRDVENYETILSGDLNGDDIDVSNPSDLFDEPTRSDNCSSIVIGSGTNRTAILDGFIITGGRVRIHPAVIDAPTGIGGGMKNESGSPTVNNCTFTGNAAMGSGGGMFNGYDSSPTFINCTFTNNYADDGAGMSSSISSIWEPTQGTGTKLIDCTFEDNNAKRSGGGLYVYKDEAVLTDCTFIGNSASKGGGIYSGSGNSMISYCQFISNSASVSGGGLSNREDCNLTMTNCLIVGNCSEDYGGGIQSNGELTLLNCTIFGNRTNSYDGGGVYFQVGRISNSIIYGNIIPGIKGSEIAQGPHGATGCRPEFIKITHSLVGNDPNAFDIPQCYSGEWLYADPLFVNPGYWDPNGTPDDTIDDFWIDGDYHLKSQASRWDPASQSWVVDDVTSPCIDAGDPNMPVGDEPMPNGGIINMGAYGGTEQASLSLSTVHTVGRIPP